MKTRRQHTRDTRENRFEREEKFARPVDTLPGNTLRGRAPIARGELAHPTQSRVGFEVALASTVLPTNRGPVAATHRTSFGLSAPLAQSVQLAGSFNDWNPEATPLSKHGSDEWRTELSLEPGVYEYKFIVDGTWQEDPSACESVGNPFGSRNSLKQVG